MTGVIYPVEGIRLGVSSSGARYKNRLDLAVIALAEGSEVAAVFTQNSFCAAPVTLARQHLSLSKPRMLLINSGQANAGTGQQGIDDALYCCQALADKAGILASEVLPFSTGVIGEPLVMDKIISAMPETITSLNTDGWVEASQAILTTDTCIKLASTQVELDGKVVTVTGMTKGSGMICPNMATMLAFVTTDAGLEQETLQQCLKHAVEGSFNRITVDGDTSTNDACVLVATGASGVRVEGGVDNPLLKMLQLAIDVIFQDLAKAIVRDGEGATKLVTVRVSKGQTLKECLDVAYSIAHSPLVKTALFAEDPNWGRLLSAVGNAGIEHFDLSRVEIYLDDQPIVKGGQRASEYDESSAARIMSQSEYTIIVELGRGDAETSVWTCDLSYDYVKINAEYRS